MTQTPTNMDKLHQQLAEAEAAGNKDSVARLKRIIGNIERNHRNREAESRPKQGQKRKNEAADNGKPKRFRFVDTDTASFSKDTTIFRDMLLEERDRETAELKRKEQERMKAEAEAKKRREWEEAKRKAEKEYQERRQREEARQKAREEEYRRQNPKPDPRKPKPAAPKAPTCQAPRPVTVQEIQNWRTFALACFNDYSKIQTFPAPPGGCCTKASCQANKSDRALDACDCAIARAFRHTVTTNARLKLERLKWHPDKFSSCYPDDPKKRELVQKKAREVFVVVQGMCEKK